MEIVHVKSSLKTFPSQASYFRKLWRLYFETEHPKAFQIFMTKTIFRYLVALTDVIFVNGNLAEEQISSVNICKLL